MRSLRKSLNAATGRTEPRGPISTAVENDHEATRQHPERISGRLSDAVAEPRKDAKVITALTAQGIEPKIGRPADFAIFIESQLNLHRKLAQDMHLELLP